MNDPQTRVTLMNTMSVNARAAPFHQCLEARVVRHQGSRMRPARPVAPPLHPPGQAGA
jgi:hypothetical protein